MKRRSISGIDARPSWRVGIFVVWTFLACGDDVDSSGGAAGGPVGGAGGGGAAGGTQNVGGAVGGEGEGGGGTLATGGAGGVEDPWEPLESLKSIDLGDVPVDEDFSFPIPDRVLGFTTLSESGAATLALGVQSLRAPSGASVIDELVVPGHSHPFAGWATVVAANPLSDLVDAQPTQQGMWTLRLDGSAALQGARTRVFARRTSDGAFHGGVLDVHVYIAPGAGVSGSYIESVVATMFASYYEPGLGISQGDVNVGPLSSSYDLVGSYAEYDQLLASGPTWASAPAINLFVIGGFSGEVVGDLGEVVGLAPGIPGSSMVHGTRLSGVAFAPTGDVAFDATVIAHEIGHFGGLFHTSEGGASDFDPLDDTPECQTVIGDPMSCPDLTNMMFPLAGTAAEFTPHQALVLQGSALYRGILEEGGDPAPPSSPIDPFPAKGPIGPPLVQIVRPVDRSTQTPLERLLHAHWCARSDVAASAAARFHSQEDRDSLRAIASDPAGFDLARARALLLLVRLSELATERDDAASLAITLLREPSSRRNLRATAIRTLQVLRPAVLGSLGERELGEDPVLRELARAASLPE